MRRARSSWNGTSIAKIAPVAGRLEDRRDARGRAGDEQQVGIGADEERSPAALQRRADRRAEVDRRALRVPSRSRCRASRPRRPAGAACRAPRGRARAWNACRYSSAELGERPRAGIPQPQRRRPRGRLPGANAISHSGRCATPRSNTTLTLRRSNPATATPVIAPTTADASTTWRDRVTSERKSSRRLIELGTGEVARRYPPRRDGGEPRVRSGETTRARMRSPVPAARA